jgi:hypothetical protein
VKGLAEFVMRGRPQALFVAVACAGSLLFSWISAAVVALVTLRKGAGQGAWLLFWALLPAGTVWYVFGDSGPLALLLGTLVLALVLRATVNLPLALLASVAVGVACGLLMLAVAGEYLQQLVAFFDGFLSRLEQQLSQGGNAVTVPRPDAVQVAGMLGAGTAMTSVLCLLLARYWQAALYNPGGFGEEFRALRYPVGMTLGLVVAAVAVASVGFQMRTWMMIFFIPLTFAGLALVHARAHARGQGAGWLGVFYAAWVMFDPVKLLVVFFAIADSWLDFRRRWQPRSQDVSAPRDGEDGPDRDKERDRDRDENDQDKDGER